MKCKHVALVTAFILLMTTFNCSNQSQSSSAEDSFQEIIQTHLRNYPKMQIEDVYKLVHQAAMGNIHLGVDATMLRNYLVREMSEIQASDEEPLVEKISPAGLVRINLRPYKAMGGESHQLLEAMRETAGSFTPDKQRIVDYWKVVEELADKGSIPFAAGEVKAFIKEMEVKGFPAVHHSREYADLYRPAYRVILKRYLPEQQRLPNTH